MTSARLLRNRYGYRVANHVRVSLWALRTRPRNRLRVALFAVSGGAVELFGSGHPNITMTTTAAVTEGRIVEVSGDRSIRHGQAATLKALGVAKQTGSAVGDKIAVATGGVWHLRAQGAINAGDQVMVSAGNDGRVAPVPAVDATNVATLGTGLTNTRATVGIALAAIADGADGPVLLKGLA